MIRAKQLVLICLMFICVCVLNACKGRAKNQISTMDMDSTDVAIESTVTSQDDLLTEVMVLSDDPIIGSENSSAEESSANENNNDKSNGKSGTEKLNDSFEGNAVVSLGTSERDSGVESGDTETENSELKDKDTLGELADVPSF